MDDSQISRPKKAIIVAAGLGKRLRPYTDEMPKSMVPIAGKPMLLRSLAHFRSVGVTEFIIVRGYKASYFDSVDLGPGVTFVDNLDYENNNILLSLFTAEKHINGAFYFSYSDIIWAVDVIKDLAAAKGDICVIVDKDYKTVYEGRTDHPLEQAELCTLDSEGFIKQIGKCSCDYSEAVGEFIGLAKFSEKGGKQLLDAFNDVRKEYEGTVDKPFVRAKTWTQTYVCDLLEHMTLSRGVKMVPVFIHGRWREIDTVQDKERADKTVDW